jgi:hypothetical protein
VYLSGNLSHEIGTIGFGTVRRLKSFEHNDTSALLLPIVIAVDMFVLFSIDMTSMSPIM